MKRELTAIITAVLLGVLAISLSKVHASDGPAGSDRSGANYPLAPGDKDKKAGGAAVMTFTRDVAPILYARCADCHHAGEAAPFSVLSYKDVRPWARSIKEKVVNRQMPPWHADPHVGQWANDRRLTDQEIQRIAAWVDQGAREGDPSDMPPAPAFPDGWRIGKPDVIFELPEENTLDATGPDEYQYFDVPTNFTEDKWVQMAEARPGNRKIVHHIVVFIVPPGAPTVAKLPKEMRNKAIDMSLDKTPFYRDGLLIRMKSDQPVYNDAADVPANLREFNTVDDFFTGYAPGGNYGVWLPGTAKKIQAGSTIRFQIHYSKVAGAVEKDRSMLGLVFAKKPPARVVRTRGIANMFFQVPPQADNQKVSATWNVKTDLSLYSLMPHMHYRGKAMKFEVTYPDGRTQTLLDVPDYSFSWQTAYNPQAPIQIPAGSKILVSGYFDNSAKNKSNPDPSKSVRYGEPTYDEMMVGFIDYVAEKPKNPVKLDPAAFAKLEGRYDIGNQRTYTISREGDRYYGQPAGPRGPGVKRELFAVSDLKFLVPDAESQITFVKNSDGDVNEFVYESTNGSLNGKRVKAYYSSS
ncbi:MAG TPA: cytochrome c [Blastocatellia bacterium]|nr:cytochrome c [Blastocatellia bacterium]